MPPRKNYRKKRTYKRKYKSRVPKQLITNRFSRTFKYVETKSYNPGIATAAINTYSANGMADPDITGFGHQPLGFDQLVGVLYDNYTVIGARIRCHFASSGTSGTISQFRVGVSVRDTAGFSGSGTTLIEQGRTNWKTITPIGGKSQAIVTNKISISKFLGRSNVMSDSQLKGDATNNPTEQAYFLVWVAGIDDSEDGGAVFVTTEIEYLAVLTEPKLLGPS